jgi:hypothetical protein
MKSYQRKEQEKDMKKLRGFVLAGIAVVLFLFPAMSRAAEIEVQLVDLNEGKTLPSYKAGDTLIVQGFGQLNANGWRTLKIAPAEFALVLNNGQTFIPAGDSASAFPKLLSLTAEKVTRVEKMAFIGSPLLEKVSLPAATTIAENAFNTCANLKNVSLPKASSLGTNAFAGCSKLESIALPLVTTIPSRAFANCTTLKSFDLPLVQKIEQSAFDSCSALTKLSLPAAKEIDLRAFYRAISVTEVFMPKVTTIGSEAFAGCTALSVIRLGDADPSVAPNAFSGVPRVTIYSNRKFLTSTHYPPYSMAHSKSSKRGSGGCDTGMGFLGLLLFPMALYFKGRARRS